MTKNTINDRSTAIGVFHNHAEAQQAVRELKAAGFGDDQIGVVSQDRAGTYTEQVDQDSKAAGGAATGAAVGLGTGALWGLGIAAGVLPAIGPVIAGGTLAAIAASAAGTAAVGGLAGALIGAGIPEEEATYYEQQFETGRTIVTVHAGKDKYTKAANILDGSNAYDYQRRDTKYAHSAAEPKRANLAGELVARKEVLSIDKHQEIAGQAKIRKEVHTEQKTVEVPVKREELVVERTKLNRESDGSITSGTEEERVTLREEVLDVQKKTIDKEAVKLGKRAVTETKTVGAEVREEEIVVDHGATGRTSKK